MADFLLEILSEEIPARMQKDAAEQLEAMVREFFKAQNLSYGQTKTYVTPRRLTIVAFDVQELQEDIKTEKRGPQTSAPEQALQGFIKANDLSDIDQAEIRNIKGKDYYFTVMEQKGQPTSTLLQQHLPKLLAGFAWPKSMRFLEAGSTVRWVRPIRNILCVFGSDTISFEFGGVSSNNLVYGHRFMSPEAEELRSISEYEKQLFENMVLADRDLRRQAIVKAMTEIAEANHIILNLDDGLLEEVTGLVEWPTAILGHIDQEFMEIPEEVLITALKEHQKYFTLNTKNNKLAPNFITISNMVTEEPDIIRHGNERVLRARLYDAKFFWDQDRKSSLNDKLPALKSMIFQQSLGSQYDRALRFADLAKTIAPLVGADSEKAYIAAKIAKADLVSSMVFEFPEVQGIMGKYYALHDGYDEDVALAIEQHYQPAGVGDNIPNQPLSVALALSDKLDALVGFWAIGKKPTGSGDPFSLRRAALGIIHLLNNNDLYIPLNDLIMHSIQNWKASGLLTDAQLQNVADDLAEFFSDRMKVAIKDQGFNANIGASLLEKQDRKHPNFTPALIWKRAEALQEFLSSSDGENLLAGIKRAGNIIAAEEKQQQCKFDQHVDQALFQEAAETTLFTAIKQAQTAIDHALKDHDFTAAMKAVSTLRTPIDQFLDNVLVNIDNDAVKRNRLCLLANIPSSLADIADFSQLT